MHSPIALFGICGPLSLDHTLNRYYVGGNMQIWRFNALQMLNTVYIYIKNKPLHTKDYLRFYILPLYMLKGQTIVNVSINHFLTCPALHKLFCICIHLTDYIYTCLGFQCVP